MRLSPRLWLAALASVVLAVIVPASADDAPTSADDAALVSGAPRLSLPLACTIGETCFIQFHVDLDEGPDILDYACGRLTYDGHHGTDIRVPDLPTMRAGVGVLAAAEGMIRAIRDGEPDISVELRGREGLEGKDAGNAVVVDHGGGWVTQYSHLMNGSIVVKPGDHVQRGQLLGKIGLSGRSNFPHLDFQVHYDGQVVDPFVGQVAPTGCHAQRTPLWDEPILGALAYRPSGVLIAGFADERPDKVVVREGGERALSFTTDAPMLVFYVDTFGVRAGDIEEFSIVAPDGHALIHHRNELDKDGHQRFYFIGRKRPVAGWRPGIYRGEYRLTRDGAGKREIVAEVVREAIVTAP
jgi:hypothetical protein